MLSSNQRQCVALAILMMGFVSGCGGGQITHGPAKSKVQGEVKWEGRPLSQGQIQFIDETGDPPLRYVADIFNGQFSCDVTPGKKRVEVMAFKPEGNVPRVPGPGEDSQFIPAKFNAESTLTATIAADANEPLKFDLKK